ncbi:hypothetical protein ES705_14223 [subsurface metagenome]
MIFMLFFITTCKSPEKLLQQGNYDAAIDRSIKMILKGKADNKDKSLLDKAYNLANQDDHERIKFLKVEGKPENWEEIYRRYNSLNTRQNKIQKVSPLIIGNKKVIYEYIDYTDDIIEAKTNAATYYYKKGLSNMNLHTKEGYRQAYFDFRKTEAYRTNDYPELNQLISDAQYFGMSHVLVELVNKSRVQLPDDFYDNILNINTSGLNSTWVEYYFRDLDRDIQYDYFIRVELHNIHVTPDEFSRREYIRRKEVEDGYKYSLDRRGNVRKDSLGNDIKVPRYKVISCKVIETKQFKTASIHGELEFLYTAPRRSLKKEPVAATLVFEHLTARAFGELEALELTDMKLLKVEILPFPDDLSMIYDCTEILKNAVNDVIHNNRRLIK